MNLNENNLMVYPLDIDKIDNFLTLNIWGSAREKRRKNQSLEISRDAIIEVSDGFFMITADCCYQISETSLVKLDSFYSVVEVLSICFRIKNHEKKGDITSTTRGPEITYNIAGDQIIKEYAQTAISLREFMGSRYRYNPRVSKNMVDILKTINDLKND